MPRNDLLAEVEVFTRYLIGQPADEYIRSKYVQYFTKAGDERTVVDPLDSYLVAFAAKSELRARVADAYASVFRKHSLLRRKLVLLTALLECSPAHHHLLGQPDSGPKLLLLLRLGWAAVIFIAATLAGVAIFMPLRWSTTARSRVRQQA